MIPPADVSKYDLGGRTSDFVQEISYVIAIHIDPLLLVFLVRRISTMEICV
jgi:hypothetical protein